MLGYAARNGVLPVFYTGCEHCFFINKYDQIRMRQLLLDLPAEKPQTLDSFVVGTNAELAQLLHLSLIHI